MVATLGQITDGGYVLVIPKQHIACMGALATCRPSSLSYKAEGLMFKVACTLSLTYHKEKSSAPFSITAFEHGVVGQTVKHAHLHIVPVALDFTARISADFPNIKIEELEYPSDLQTLYKENPQPYLFWTAPGFRRMVCWDPPAPAQYLRLIAADLLGRPERGNWKNMNPELDKRLVGETVRLLKPHFPQYYFL